MDTVLLCATIGLRVIGTISVAACAWAIWAAQTNPRLLLKMNEELGQKDFRRIPSAKYSVALTLVSIGFGIASYGGAYFGLSWVPENWGAKDGVEDWFAPRQLLALLAGIVGASAMIQFLLEFSRMKAADLQRTAPCGPGKRY